MKSGYSLIHPNCRHQFVPFYESSYTPDKLKEIQAYSNRSMKIPDRETEAYKKWQSENRQRREEFLEYTEMKNTLKAEMPYKTLGDYRKGKRINSETYQQVKKRLKRVSEQKAKEFIPPMNPKIKTDWYKEKFNQLDFKPQIIKSIRESAQRCIKINDKTPYERLVMIDITGKSEDKVFRGGYRNVIFDEYMLKGIPNNSLIFVHNHPSGESFSYYDIMTLSNVPQIHTMIAAGHNGEIYSLSIKNGKRVDNNFSIEYNKIRQDLNGNIHKTVEYLAELYKWEYKKL